MLVLPQRVIHKESSSLQKKSISTLKKVAPENMTNSVAYEIFTQLKRNKCKSKICINWGDVKLAVALIYGEDPSSWTESHIYLNFSRVKLKHNKIRSSKVKLKEYMTRQWNLPKRKQMPTDLVFNVQTTGQPDPSTLDEFSGQVTNMSLLIIENKRLKNRLDVAKQENKHIIDSMVVVKQENKHLVDSLCVMKQEHKDLVDSLCVVKQENKHLVDSLCIVKQEHKDLIDSLCIVKQDNQRTSDKNIILMDTLDVVKQEYCDQVGIAYVVKQEDDSFVDTTEIGLERWVVVEQENE